MTLKRTIATSLLFLVLLAAGLAAVFWAGQQEPEFYRKARTDRPNPKRRRVQAEKLSRQTLRLAETIQDENAFSEEFTQSQVNSWLSEELPGRFAEFVPPGVSQPRVHFSQDVVQLGFRYASPQWQGVVSLRLKPRMAEANRLILEIDSLRAGLMPLPMEKVLRQVQQHTARSDWSVEWRQADEHYIVAVDLEPFKSRPVCLEEIAVGDGVLSIRGRSKPVATAQAETQSATK